MTYDASIAEEATNAFARSVKSSRLRPIAPQIRCSTTYLFIAPVRPSASKESIT